LVSDAMLVAEGMVPGPGSLLVRHDGEEDEDEGEPTPLRLTPLDPHRPARDLLEDLLSGIYGCGLLYDEYADAGDGEEQAAVDEAFCIAVSVEAETNKVRLM
jgi:hypothetical protein